MNELKLPQLWFARMHIPTGRVFKDPITHRLIPDWDRTPISMLHGVAIKRIAELNTKMPTEWEYAILGWDHGGDTVMAEQPTKPAERKPLTDEQIAEIRDRYHRLMGPFEFARAIEAAHGITGETK